MTSPSLRKGRPGGISGKAISKHETVIKKKNLTTEATVRPSRNQKKPLTFNQWLKEKRHFFLTKFKDFERQAQW
jgi:hypothetical protein